MPKLTIEIAIAMSDLSPRDVERFIVARIHNPLKVN